MNMISYDQCEGLLFKPGDTVVLLASYCDKCTDENPCDTCLAMCNRFMICGVHEYLGGYDYFFHPHWANIDDGHLLDTPICSVLTDDPRKLAWGYSNILETKHARKVDSKH